MRYVGQTVRPVARFRVHTSGHGDSHCGNWERSLLRRGLRPTFIVLEDVYDENALDDSETWWISFGRNQEWPLTNIVDGGETTDGFKGRTHSQESRAKMSASHLGRKKSAAHRAAIGRANGGKKRTREMNAEHSRKLTGRVLSEKHRANISKGMAEAWQDGKFDNRRGPYAVAG